MERTTNLELLKGGTPYTWGNMVKIHNIGEYDIVEYHPWKTEGSSVLTGSPDDTLCFGCYLDGKNCCHSYESLDAAIAACIAYKYEGLNHKANEYFMRMLKVR